ncbi:MAG TPA: winged helix-turn-helix transcriptional regulator [Tepidiformaceae bacterium]|nr:winged helix-turn-helix transcriptional regulator [Tepidiformaceae bacterium]HNO66210.1 winged helix-turn-helix transcriptional regulator [Tepidiformaceae bacterium]
MRLFHHRWSVPILATLYQSGPLTFAALSQRMKASRDTLADTLANLEANGVIERQPLGRRTVFALTPRGERVGAAALPMAQVVSSAGVLHLALKKWPMLVLTALGRGATRYNEAKAALPGITARALALALKDLDAAGLIERTIEAGYPPAPIYRLSETGQRFFPPLDALCCAAIPLPGEESKT